MISFSRVKAAFTLVVLFALIVSLAILGTQYIGTQITHGNMVEHKHGFILSTSDVDNSLVFKTDSGQIIRFICTDHCLTQLEHIQRHIHEHAPTDVYYKQGNNSLMAIDVD